MKILDQIVKMFSAAAGTNINNSKTEILPIGPNNHDEVNKIETDFKILSYEQGVRLLGVIISNVDQTENVWDTQTIRIISVLKKWSNTIVSTRGRILFVKAAIVPIILFQAKFYTLPTKHLKSLEGIIWNFIKNYDSRMVSKETAQLPIEIGGVGVPILDVIVKTARISWIKELLDPKNEAEWKKMALQELDLISKTPGMGTDILLHESLLPRNKNLNFWSENLAAFFRCGGQVKDLEDSNDPTASSVLATQLTTISDNVKTLTKNGVTQLSQVIDHIKPGGTKRI